MEMARDDDVDAREHEAMARDDVESSPSTSSSSWSFDLLPPKIVAAVLRRLPSHVDRVRFAAVCRAWRAAATRQIRQPLPWLALHDGTFFSYPGSAALRFANAARYHGSSGDCLLLRGDTGGGGGGGGDGYMLVHAFSGDTVMWLPDLSSVRFSVRGGEWLSWRGITDDRRAPKDTAVRKVVMCPSAGKVVVAAAMVGDGRRLNKIAVCRPDSDSWVMSAHDAWRGFTDIAFYGGKVYAVEDTGDLFAMPVDVEPGRTGEPKVCWAKIVIKAPGDAPARRRRKAPPTMRYLLVSGGRLLMVHREQVVTTDNSATTIRFAVFRADLVSSRWSEVKTVGDDTALFVGRWTSVSRHVSPYGLPGNRIHFVDDDVFCNNGCQQAGRFGSYDMTDGTTHPLLPPLQELVGNGGSGDTPATWLFPWEKGAQLSWCDLPSDLYGLIMCRLPCREDRSHVSEVCRHWRACARRLFPPTWWRRPVAVKKAPERTAATVVARRPAAATVVAPRAVDAGVATPAVAYLALPNGKVFTYPDLTAAPGIVAADDIAGGYICAACDDWLVFEDADGVLRLSSPLTGKTRLLPSLSMANLHVHGTAVEIVNEPAPATPHHEWTDYEAMEVRKLVWCPDGGFIAAIIGREHFGKLALCSLETFSWSVSVHDRWRWYEDLAWCSGGGGGGGGGGLYAVTAYGDLLAFEVGFDGNTGNPYVSRVERVVAAVGYSSFSSSGRAKLRYLVPSSSGRGGEVAQPPLMVERWGWLGSASAPEKFAVSRADLAASRWVEIDELGYGEALFVGRLCSRSVRARLRGDDGVRGDQIFFMPDDCVGMWFWRSQHWSRIESLHHGVAVYDMRDRCVTELGLPCQEQSHGPTPPAWLFPSSDDSDEWDDGARRRRVRCTNGGRRRAF